ncbi:hypothetical protein K1719_024220 [Acacia pycnantha]|nr:hypothetical protein K1719_024220 [Acacia pycnantha]
MDLKPRLVVLVLVMAAIVVATEGMMTSPEWKGLSVEGQLVGDKASELEEEMMMESGSIHRSLRTVRYISYDALKANNVPCRRRGRSYYNCHRRGRANPYRRGCTAITHCARRTD